MAIIKCPNCNEEISDRTECCIHCGFNLENTNIIKCEECGNPMNSNETICNKCGYSVNKQNGKKKKKKAKIFIIILLFCIILAGIISIIMINKNSADKKTINNKYESKLEQITYQMLFGAVDAEKCGNKIKKVWYNSIWKKSDSETDKFTKKNGKFNSDFNDSLSNLFKDSEFKELIKNVQTNKEEVAKLMKNMKNPPDEWKDAYEALKEFYDDYLYFLNLCINPSGSLQSFSTNFNDADTKSMKSYEKVLTYFND